MSNTKEIRFSPRIDDSLFVQDLANLQKKIKDFEQQINGSFQKMRQNPSIQAMGAMGQAAQGAFNNSNNVNSAFERQNRVDQVNHAKTLSQAYTDLNNKLKAELLFKKEGMAATEKELQLLKEIANIKSQMNLPGYNGENSSNGKNSNIPSKSDPKNGLDAVNQAIGIVKNAAIVAAITTAIKFGFGQYQATKQAPITAASAQGSAIQGIYGREVEAMYSGRGGIESSYLSEKQAAMKMAKQQQLGHQISNEFSQLGLAAGRGDPEAQKALRAIAADQLNQDYNKALQGLISQDPSKRAAREHYTSNMSNYLNFQRQMGLNYGTFHDTGGFRDQAQNAGFADPLAMEMSSKIMTSGGSTGSSGIKSAILGLQAERNYNLTNSGGILGKLGSVNNNDSGQKNQLIEILAIGTKRGFDGSHFVEESRKFTETVADIIAKTGGGSSEDAARAARRFSDFVADPTTTGGINAAKDTYERWQQLSSATTGGFGVMRASGILSDPRLSKMSFGSQANLAGIESQFLTNENPLATGMAREAGLEGGVDELNDLNDEIVRNTRTRNRQAFAARNRVLEFNKKNNIRLGSKNWKTSGSEGQTLVEDLAKELHRDYKGKNDSQSIFSDLEAFMGYKKDEMLPGATPTLTAAMARSGYNGETTAPPASLTNTGPSGKIEDLSLKNEAEYAKEILKAFKESKDSLVPTTEALRLFNKELEKTMLTVSKNGIQTTDYLNASPEYQTHKGVMSGNLNKLDEILDKVTNKGKPQTEPQGTMPSTHD